MAREKNSDRETIINFSEVDEEATVYTCNRKFKNKLKRMGFEPSETDAIGGELYTIPRELIQIRKPREITEEQAEAGAARLAAARKAAGIGEFAKGKKGKKGKKAPKKIAPVVEEDDDDEDEDDEEEEEVAPARKLKKAPVKPAKVIPLKKKRAVVEDDDEDEEDEDEDEDDDDDDDDEEVEVVERRPAGKSAKPAKKGSRR